MSKINALEFGKYVDTQRKRLINDCIDKGIILEDDNISLSQAVDAELSLDTETESYLVEFRDIDGTLLKSESVLSGSNVSLPENNPNFDSEYLEFVEWNIDGDITNTPNYDVLAMPIYRTKYVEAYQQRPTYIFCTFTANTLSPTLATPTHVNTYVDWGDGSAVEAVNTNTIQHTYATAGDYVITVYGESYRVGGNITAGIFTTATYRSCPRKLYIGNNVLNTTTIAMYNDMLYLYVPSPDMPDYSMNGNSFWQTRSLFSFVSPRNITGFSIQQFSECTNLHYFMFPNNARCSAIDGFITGGMSSLRSYVVKANVVYDDVCPSLKNAAKSVKQVVILNNSKQIPSSGFVNCKALKRLILPNTLETISISAFNNANSITKLIFPVSLKTLNANALSGCTSLKSIDLTNITNIGNNALPNSAFIKELIIPNNCSVGNYAFAISGLKRIVINNVASISTSQFSLSIANNVEEIVIPKDFDFNFNLYNCALNTDSLIQFCKNLKDNTGLTAKALGIYQNCLGQYVNIYVDASGNKVDSSTSGAMNLIQYLTTKNWTISIQS